MVEWKSKSFCLLVVGLMLSLTCVVHAGDREAAEARKNLDGLRGIQLPKGPQSKQEIAALNQRMDSAWRFFEAHKDTLPLAEVELAKELDAKTPDLFFIMDVGFLLMVHEGEKSDKAAGLALSALERIDPEAEIIRSNWAELFHLTMKLGASGKDTDRYLKQVDRIYLNNKTSVDFFQAPHVVQLTPTDVECMTYGVAGEAAAKHLCSLLHAPGVDQKKIVTLLNITGSEANTPEVKALMESSSDYEMIIRCVSFLMEVGGPSGRDAVLKIDLQKVDAKSREYLKEIRSSVEKLNFSLLAATLTKMNSKKVSDSKMQRLLDKMEENNGQDDETPPGALVKAGIPKERLLARMKRIRARSFRRETNHVFEELPIDNLVINALQFK